MTTLFLTGATGYIGGTVGRRLVADGHRVRGLVRDPARAPALAALGIEPVIGGLDDLALLDREARAADGVVDTAHADHPASAQAFLAALAGSGKPYLRTSGSSVIGDDARGEAVAAPVYDEDTPFVVAAAKQPRHRIDQAVLAAAGRGIRSAVVCPALIYGAGAGLNPDSVQVPFLVAQAREHGRVRVVGRGLNRWSNVHIDDLAELYRLVLDRAPGGAFYFAENGEASFAEVGAAIAKRLALGEVGAIAPEAAAKAWGEARAYYSFGSNSRVRAVRARRELGWTPRAISLTDWIATAMPV